MLRVELPGIREISIASVQMGDLFYSLLLALGAFGLGACPFSVWIGQWRLGKDIRDYGDGNPGSANVFRSGGRKLGSLALGLDILKGVPFVALAHWFFNLSEPAVLAVAVSAILGHAFSPLLRFKGGKAVAITFGVMLALPQHEILAAFAVFMVLGFLFIQSDSWAVILAAAGSLACLAIMGARPWETLFMLCVLAILVLKHYRELQTIPSLNGRLIGWLQIKGRET